MSEGPKYALCFRGDALTQVANKMASKKESDLGKKASSLKKKESNLKEEVWRGNMMNASHLLSETQKAHKERKKTTIFHHLQMEMRIKGEERKETTNVYGPLMETRLKRNAKKTARNFCRALMELRKNCRERKKVKNMRWLATLMRGKELKVNMVKDGECGKNSLCVVAGDVGANEIGQLGEKKKAKHRWWMRKERRKKAAKRAFIARKKIN